MKTINIVLSGVLSLGLVSISFAQKSENKQEQQKSNPKANHKDIYSDLGLTKTQTKQVHSINKKYSADIKKVESNKAISKEEKKKSISTLKDKRNAELKQVMSADQYAKLEKIRYAKKVEKKGNKEDKLKEKLSLSDDQVNQVKKINETYKPKLKAIKEDTTLSEEVKKSKIKVIQEAKHKEINAILTPDQQKKFKEMNKEKK
jgi:hypothetical protein